MRLFQPTYRDAAGNLKKSRKWWVRYYVRGRRFEKPLGTRDKRAAEILAGEMVKAGELRAVGLETHDETRAAGVEPLVTEYETELRRRNRDDEHIERTIFRVRKLLEGVSELVAVTPEAVRKALDRVTGERDLTARTANFYRVALHGFFRWLVREGRWTRNPVEAVVPARVTGNARNRRALAPEELDRLLATAPAYRALVYLVAATTGLRRGELRSLLWMHVDLVAATLSLPAAAAKNRHEEPLPLPAGVVEALRAARGEAKPEENVFPTVPTVETFYGDLRAAGIERETGGRIADFHALRTTMGTSLARAGVPLVVAQRLMRHSDPKLTANVYSKLEVVDYRAAVARIDRTPAASEGRPAKRRRRRAAGAGDADADAAPAGTAAGKLSRPLSRSGVRQTDAKGLMASYFTTHDSGLTATPLAADSSGARDASEGSRTLTSGRRRVFETRASAVPPRWRGAELLARPGFSVKGGRLRGPENSSSRGRPESSRCTRWRPV